MAKPVIWSTEARADIRAIDCDTALRLLKALSRFLKTDAGNVKQLEGLLTRRCFVSASATGVLSIVGGAMMPLKWWGFAIAAKHTAKSREKRV